MSSKNNPLPATDMPVLTDENFGMDLFWEQHKTKVLIGAVALVVIVIAVGAGIFFSHSAKVASERAFSLAKTPEAWQEVVEKYPSSQSAAAAHFLLAESLRQEGKLADSTAHYEELIKRFPKYPLVGNARIGIAENLDLQGKMDEAVAAFQAAADQDSGTFAGPLALLMEGRLLLREGKSAEARKVFSRLRDADPDSLPGRVAMSQLAQLDVVYSGPKAADSVAKPQ